MSWLTQPDGSKLELFGSGGGQTVADRLTETLGDQVDVIGQIPLDVAAGAGSDAGVPIVLSDPDSPAAAVITDVARKLTHRSRGLAGRSRSEERRVGRGRRSKWATSRRSKQRA